MKCPYCESFDHGVLESRACEDNEGIRRRRQCEGCQMRFTTYERVEGVDIIIIKKNGRKESFDRLKMRKGLLKATWKRPVSIDQVDHLIDEIERSLRLSQQLEIKSSQIGQLVVQKLKVLDPIAYLLFSSVYKDFSNLDDFQREMDYLKNC